MTASAPQPKKKLRPAMFLAGGSVASALSSFVRNIIIARLVSVEDFGVAATFALTIAAVEMASNLATDRLLVQATDGDDESLQSSAHFVQATQGVIGALVLYLAAKPLALLFEIHEVTWAFEVLAVIPLIRGFAHLDRARLQRELQFLPAVFVESGSQVLATILAIPLGLYFKNYQAMLWVLMSQAIIFTLISFLVSKRMYRISWNTRNMKRFFSFGWPLFFNGILMFGVLHGDRTIVGSAFSMQELGWFSAAFALTLAPTLALAKVSQSFFLPQLASKQAQPIEFNKVSQVCMQFCAFGGALISFGFVTVGPALLVFLFDERYIAGAWVIGLLGIAQGVRSFKFGSTIVAIAKGETRNPLEANIVRTFGIGVTLVAVNLGWQIAEVVIIALVSEIASLIVSLFLLKKRVKVYIGYMCILTVVLIGFSCLTHVILNHVFDSLTSPVTIFYGLPVIVVYAGIVFFFMKDARGWIVSPSHKAG